MGALIGVVVIVGSATSAMADPAPGRRPGRILIIRGIFTVFSLGMDTLACKLAQRGYRVDLAPPSMALLAAKTIEHECRDDPDSGPLVIIGHSLGGRFCCSIPWTWRQSGIPVKLVVILDSNPHNAVAANVERCVNLYVTNHLGMFHGRRVRAADARTDLVNLDMTKVHRPPGVPAINHFNIDDSPWIRALVIEEVERSLGGVSGNEAYAPVRNAVPHLEPRVWKEPE